MTSSKRKGDTEHIQHKTADEWSYSSVLTKPERSGVEIDLGISAASSYWWDHESGLASVRQPNCDYSAEKKASFFRLLAIHPRGNYYRILGQYGEWPNRCYLDRHRPGSTGKEGSSSTDRRLAS